MIFLHMESTSFIDIQTLVGFRDFKNRYIMLDFGRMLKEKKWDLEPEYSKTMLTPLTNKIKSSTPKCSIGFTKNAGTTLMSLIILMMFS